jgi:hypothetical protein
VQQTCLRQLLLLCTDPIAATMALTLQKSAAVQARAGARPVQALRPLTVRRSAVRVAASKKSDEQMAAEVHNLSLVQCPPLPACLPKADRSAAADWSKMQQTG